MTLVVHVIVSSRASLVALCMAATLGCHLVAGPVEHGPTAPRKNGTLVAPGREPALEVMPEPGRVEIRTTCTAQGMGMGTSRRIHELEPLALEPVVTGPRIEHLPRSGLPRTLRGTTIAMERHTTGIEQCYGWTSFHHPGLEAELVVHTSV